MTRDFGKYFRRRALAVPEGLMRLAIPRVSNAASFLYFKGAGW